MLDRIAAMTGGALLAGFGAAVVEGVGVSAAYAIAVGIALGMPLLVFAGWSRQFDVAAYSDAQWPGGVARDALGVVLVSGVVGVLAVALFGSFLGDAVLVGFAAGGAFAGGYAAAYYVARDFRA